MLAESEGASPSPDTVAGLMEDWMRSEGYRWKAGTRVKYQGLVRHHIARFIGERLGVSLKAKDIQNFYRNPAGARKV